MSVSFLQFLGASPDAGLRYRYVIFNLLISFFCATQSDIEHASCLPERCQLT